MKKLFTLLALIILFSVNAQLSPHTETADKPRQRLTLSNVLNHGPIGLWAVDLSFSLSTSLAHGATGDYSASIGFLTAASGTNSTAMGKNTIASDFGSLVIGHYNNSLSTVTGTGTDAVGSNVDYSINNTAFVIGNGTGIGDTPARSDAFKVLFNGDKTVGKDLTVSGDIVVNSDMHLKANIISLGSTLCKLLQIDGKT